MTQPYETPEFQNASQFTIAVTFVVAGGKRSFTADRRARRIFERIANHTARLKDVLEVTATGGASHDGKVSWTRPVAFAAANTGPDTLEHGKLLRYLDPDYERARRALAAANEAARLRREADRRRRSAIGCANAYPSLLQPSRRTCDCAYCHPEEHLLAARETRRGPESASLMLRCLCGRTVSRPARRCPTHRDVELDVLDDDPAPLRLLADYATPS